MSRSDYSDDMDDRWQLIRWRGAVASAIKGARGQAFLKEMLAAMDALPEHKLVANELEAHGEVCAIGAVGKARGIDMKGFDPENTELVAAKFGVAEALAREIVYMNDEGSLRIESPEDRFHRMRRWIVNNIRQGQHKMDTRTIWYAVADLTNPAAEPFAVMSVDTSIRREGGVEGTVVSLHWQREEAERIVHEFNNGPLS